MILLASVSVHSVEKQKIIKAGRGGGQVVRMLAFYSDDPSSNPAEDYSFSCKFCA